MTLTNKHFCFFIFLEMSTKDFINILQINTGMQDIVFIDPIYNRELYQEAKNKMINMKPSFVSLEFDYDMEPFVFDKYIDGKLDRAYKLCIFEQGVPEPNFIGKTSNLHIDGMPVFFDKDGIRVLNSLN